MQQKSNGYSLASVRVGEMKTILIAIMCLIGLSFTCSYAGNMENGLTAYDNGDYKTAHKFFLLEAEKGDARAQYYLGVMYHIGQGVLQDYKEAVKWWLLASDQGNAKAKCNLAEMYAAGVEIKQDLSTAKRLAKEGFDAGEKYCELVWDKYNLAHCCQ